MGYKKILSVVLLSTLFAWYVDRVVYKGYDILVEENTLLKKDIKSLMFEHKTLNAEIARLESPIYCSPVADGRHPTEERIRTSSVPYHVPTDIQQPLPYVAHP